LEKFDSENVKVTYDLEQKEYVIQDISLGIKNHIPKPAPDVKILDLLEISRGGSSTDGERWSSSAPS